MLANYRLVFVLLFILILSACTTSVVKPLPEENEDQPSESALQPSATPEEGDEPVIIQAPPRKTVYIMKPVVRKLLIKADKQIQKENYQSAVNYLERGIAISPNNPFLWQRLATIRLYQGNYQQAEQLAAKSNVLGEADDDLRLKNWQIIAEAKRLRKMHTHQ